MRLIMFDIDGTLIQSNHIEVKCFILAMQEIMGIENINTNIDAYTHITDIGIAMEIIERTFKRNASQSELEQIEESFIKHLQNVLVSNSLSCPPLPGSKKLLADLMAHDKYHVAIATGSFYRSAKLKLTHNKLWDPKLPIATCNDAYQRKEIMLAAKSKAENFYQERFDKITYVGDGIWDVKATETLNWHFIGIGEDIDHLSDHGAKQVLPHFSNVADFFEFLE